MNEYGKTPKHRSLRKLQLQRPYRAWYAPKKKKKKYLSKREKKKHRTT